MPLPAEELAFIDEFSTESDRASAVLGGAYLDFLLGELLAKRFVHGTEAQSLIKGVLRSFANRVDAAVALGLLSRAEAADLHRINKVRNHFAHRTHGFTFESDDVPRICSQLECLSDAGAVVEHSGARMTFLVAVVHYYGRLKRAAMEFVQLSEYVPPDWPPLKLVDKERGTT
jgi:hypothetical protein